MEIILKEDVDNLGLKHDIIKVKAGYARNFLIPKGKAIFATSGEKRNVEEIKSQQKLKYEKMLEEIKSKGRALVDGAIKVGAKVGQNEKIFGSVTTLQLANAIKDQKDFDVDRKQIQIQGEVKSIGSYTALVNLHRDIEPIELSFEVVAE